MKQIVRPNHLDFISVVNWQVMRNNSLLGIHDFSVVQPVNSQHLSDLDEIFVSFS